MQVVFQAKFEPLPPLQPFLQCEEGSLLTSETGSLPRPHEHEQKLSASRSRS